MLRVVKRSLFFFMLAGLIGLCLSLLGCKKSDQPLDLGAFKHVGDISISPDGDNILFTGIGHKDYPPRTVYRFQHSTGKLYRYVHNDPTIELDGARFSPSSNRFAYIFSPPSSNPKEAFEESQIGIVNMDGSEFQQATSGNGLKLSPVLTYDEKALVYKKGRYRESGKKAIVGLDLFRLDLQTKAEIQITRLAFYATSKAFVSADGRSVLFAGDSPTRLPYSDNIDLAKKFRVDYWDRYHEHIILQYAVDGSEIEKLPVPVFHYDIDFGMTSERLENEKKWWYERSEKYKYGGPGSRKPILTKDNTIWFEGKVGPTGWINHYQYFPNGVIKKIDHLKLGDASMYSVEWDVTPDGKWLISLNTVRPSDYRMLTLYHMPSGEKYELAIPAKAEDIVCGK